MQRTELLTQEEMDALLQEVEKGDMASSDARNHIAQNAVPYEFGSQEHIIRGPMPTLEMVSDRFSRRFGSSLFDMLRRETKVELTGVESVRFAEYSAGLPTYCSLHIANVRPLPGVILFLLDPNLVFSLVDGFFGGNTGGAPNSSRRELAPSELRISRMIMDEACKDLKLSWDPVYDLDFEIDCAETNPHFLNIASPTEFIVVARLKVEIGAHGGEMHVAMPYSVIEPIKEFLDNGMHSDRNGQDNHWHDQFTDSLSEVKVEMGATLIETDLPLGDVLTLKRGDIIPVDVAEQVSLCIAGVPVLCGAFGVSRGRNSIKVTQAANIDREMLSGASREAAVENAA